MHRGRLLTLSSLLGRVVGQKTRQGNSCPQGILWALSLQRHSTFQRDRVCSRWRTFPRCLGCMFYSQNKWVKSQQMHHDVAAHVPKYCALSLFRVTWAVPADKRPRLRSSSLLTEQGTRPDQAWMIPEDKSDPVNIYGVQKTSRCATW